MLNNKLSEIIHEVISQTPFLEHFLKLDILNISALSKKISNYLNKEANEQVSSSSVLMALKRYCSPFDHKLKETAFYISDVNQITVNSNLKFFRYKKDSNFNDTNIQYVEFKNATNSRSYLFETNDWFTIIIEKKYELYYLDFISIKPWEVKDDLSAVSIYFSVEDVRYPGLYYMIFKQLAWNNINVFEISSSGNEITLIINNNRVKELIDLIQNKKVNIL